MNSGSDRIVGPLALEPVATERFAIALLALIDSCAPVGYLIGGDPMPFQGAGLLLKISILLFIPHNRSLNNLQNVFIISIIYLTAIAILVDYINDTVSDVATLRYIVFILSLWLTFKLMPPEGYYKYCKILAVIPTALAVIHIVLCFSGKIEVNGDRYFYLGNSHPNLGGEIAAITVLAAALGFRPMLFMSVTVILSYSAYLCQARSAMVTIALIILLKLLKIRQMVVASMVFAACFVVGFAYVAEPALNFVSDSVLKVDDPYRGLGTGFVGRDERWAASFEQFVDSPVIGSGIGIFESGVIAGAHSAFLYGLVSHGVFSLFLWTPIVLAMVKVMRSRSREGVIFISIMVMLLLNDRFINSNIYPFFIYVALLSHPSVWKRRGGRL